MKLFEVILGPDPVSRCVVAVSADNAVDLAIRELNRSPDGKRWTRAGLVSVRTLLEGADVLVAPPHKRAPSSSSRATEGVVPVLVMRRSS